MTKPTNSVVKQTPEALDALLTVRDSIRSAVPNDLIERILAIETTYQFDSDRKIAIDQIDDLIEKLSGDDTDERSDV